MAFVEGGKPENPEKTHGGKMITNNKLDPYIMGPHCWEASVFNTAQSRLPVRVKITLKKQTVLFSINFVACTF